MNVLFTAGTQFPFARMARVVERVAERCPEWRLVFQAGPGASDSALPGCTTAHANLNVAPMFPQEEFEALFQQAELVVTHAGMGNLLLCLERAKPFFMLPRLASLREHRNDHQRDTAEAISERYGVPVFFELEPLVEAIICVPKEAPPALVLREAIERERRAFAKRLNSLVESL
ncbi:hypothetical protein HOP53_05105 [Halomonas sp. MCCC 1A11081]|uniref:Glycosyl transferase family 28 C-terminal domain-containing protein n=2 Tax=Billgrantia ethanolica TaxID=2733486 RepID=A0ABS9A097_9GAMM|nr:glycosyltransferase [Halomonas ethanolica]MCE8002210.1 hypothetical protein [Halomonas ethanolica]